MIKLLKSKKIIFTIIAVIILLIFFTQINLFTPIEGLLTAAFKPLQTILYKTGESIDNSIGLLTSIKKIKKENEELKEKITELTTENFELKNLMEQSDILKEELTFINAYDYEYVSAKIIGRDPDSLLKTIIINKGTKTGIKKDQPVIAGNGILIGRIIEVNDYIAKALLLSDSRSLVSATIDNSTKTPGLVSGKHGISLKMTMIPQDQEVKEDDLVITAGLETKTPPNLLIGNIEKISQIEGELFKTATIKPAISYENLSIVSVLTL